MSKTLTRGEDGAWALNLTVGGFSYEQEAQNPPEPVYTVLVLDATSSMGGDDDGDDKKTTADSVRWTNVAAAAKAYINTLIDEAGGREVHIAVVSFGYGARVHTYGKDELGGGAVGDRTKKSPDGTTDENLNDVYIGGWRGGEKDSDEWKGNDKSLYAMDGSGNDVTSVLTSYRGNAKSDYFYGNEDGDALIHIIDNISQYSGTNVQSGLLLAGDLLSGVTGKKSVVLMTDGESAATSTFAQLFRDPLDGVNLANVYEMSSNGNYVGGLYAAAESALNPFDGNWHNVDVNTSHGERIIPLRTTSGRVGMLDEAARLADKNGYEFKDDCTLPPAETTNKITDIDVAQTFLENVHAMLDSFGAVDEETGKYIAFADKVTDDDAEFWNDAVKSLFWQGVYMTYVKEGTTDENKTVGSYTADEDAAAIGMPVPDSKDPRAAILDYMEGGNSHNPYGSNSVRAITEATAAALKGDGVTVYAVGVGQGIKSPDSLRNMTSPDVLPGGSRHFYIAYHNADEKNDPVYVGIQMAKEKLTEMALNELGYRIRPAENVTIRDTLAPGFSADVQSLESKAAIVRSYYTVGAEKLSIETETAALTPNNDADSPLADGQIRVAGSQVSVNVGKIWDEATARLIAENGEWGGEDFTGKKLYVKASITFPIQADTASMTVNTWINSNTAADFTYTLDDPDMIITGPSYITPQIYIPYTPPVTTTTPTPSETPEEPEDTDAPEESEDTDAPEEPELPGDSGGSETPAEPEPGPSPIIPGLPPDAIVRPGTPDVPPEPSVPGGVLQPQTGEDGEEFFIELDEDGVPLGEWHYVPPEEVWIFEQYPPLGDFEPPRTGEPGVAAASLTALASAACLLLAARPPARWGFD
jgi:hypothetical protein